MSVDRRQLLDTLARLDRWLDTMRGPGGYGGPVVHWWRHCLHYTGAGLDWRYEGVIGGYLALWRSTGGARFLAKARRAGEDLVRGQLPGGNFRASSFELNPASGGTPHEAACDLALLELAAALRNAGHERWRRYLGVAERNLRSFYLAQCWDGEAGVLRDGPGPAPFVPNKAATVAEALLALAAMTSEEEIVGRYAVPILRRIVALQVRRPGSAVQGAIPQLEEIEGRVPGRYFPFYVARCVPPLLRAGSLPGGAVFQEAAAYAGEFLLRFCAPDLTWPQVVYEGGRMVRFPRWLAGAGEIYRALRLLESAGIESDPGAAVSRLAMAQQPAGAIPAAVGFAGGSKGPGRDELPHALDVLGVAGWNDKAFRFLAELTEPGDVMPGAPAQQTEQLCHLDRRIYTYIDDGIAMMYCDGQCPVYCWQRGESWARTQHPLYWPK